MAIFLIILHWLFVEIFHFNCRKTPEREAVPPKCDISSNTCYKKKFKLFFDKLRKFYAISYNLNQILTLVIYNNANNLNKHIIQLGYIYVPNN